MQFLVVAGGIFAPVAAVAGWFAGMSADPEPILAYHRWLGVAMGVVAAGLGYWAWRRQWEDCGAGMMAAFGSDGSDTWVRQMIEHHRAAIAMSEIVLTQSPTLEALAMAKDTIAKQGKEIQELTKPLSESPADPASLEPYKPANMAMHEAMMAAKGADVSEIYLRKMLEHHRGAVALSDVVLAKGTTGVVRTAAQKVKTVQSKEISMIEAMLAGQPMPMASSAPEPTKAAVASPPKAAPVPKRAAASATPTKAASRPTPTPTATNDPHAGMKM